MKFSRRAWFVTLALAVCGGAAGLVTFERARVQAASPKGMLRRLPAQKAIVLFLDFDSLRRGGMLKLFSNAKSGEEPDYQAFVRATGFDYRNDLDAAAVAFAGDGEFFVVKGRFDWRKLGSYVASQGGTCVNGLCRMPGSTAGRRISLLPLQSNLMALAVSSDDFAVTRLTEPQNGAVEPLDRPSEPVWLSIPPDSLKSADHLPSGTRMFATALASADRILLSLDSQGQQLEARLAVTCRTSTDAITLVKELERATSLLRETIIRENQKPNPKDLSGVLTAGVFEQAGRRVVGRWALPPAFLESLAGGTL